MFFSVDQCESSVVKMKEHFMSVLQGLFKIHHVAGWWGWWWWWNEKCCHELFSVDQCDSSVVKMKGQFVFSVLRIQHVPSWGQVRANSFMMKCFHCAQCHSSETQR